MAKREKMAETARLKWESLTEEEERQLKLNIAAAMRKVHASRTPEERRAIARKAATTRKMNRLIHQTGGSK